MLLYVRNNTTCFFFQALVKGGLGPLARDPSFVSVTKKEMADAMHIPISEMEGVARGILNKRSAPTSVKKRRPIPVLPSVPAATAQETGQPDPAVRRKRRPIPMIPSDQEPAEADSNV